MGHSRFLNTGACNRADGWGTIPCFESVAGAGAVRIRCCGAGADLNWGTKGLNAREVSGGGFGRSDGDLSGGDTAVGDLPEESYLGRSPLVPVAGGPGPEDVFNHARVPPVPRFW